jgi:hypothetical protein
MAGTIVADTIQDGAGNSTAMDNAIYGSAKAWVNWNGTNGVIRASYNVSSVTRTATGRYTVNITNALTDANYCVNITTDFSVTAAPVTGLNGSLTTSNFGVATNNSSGTATDNTYVFASCFR